MIVFDDLHDTHCILLAYSTCQEANGRTTNGMKKAVTDNFFAL